MFNQEPPKYSTIAAATNDLPPSYDEVTASPSDFKVVWENLACGGGGGVSALSIMGFSRRYFENEKISYFFPELEFNNSCKSSPSEKICWNVKAYSVLWKRGQRQTDCSQLAFYVNLHRAVIGPSATLTGRWRPDIDLRRMLTGLSVELAPFEKGDKMLKVNEYMSALHMINNKQWLVIGRYYYNDC